MASSAEEQSDAMQCEAPALQSDEVPLVTSDTLEQKMDTQPDIIHPSVANFPADQTELVHQREKTSEFHHHASEKGEGAQGSAFHLVGNADKEKEISDCVQKEPSSPFHGTVEGVENVVAKDGAETLKISPDEIPEKQAKHFSAQIVNQLEDLPKEESERIYPEADDAGSENEMLGITQDKSDIQGMDIEELDEAVEKSLLSEADDDSLSKEGTRHMNEDMEVSPLSTQVTEVSEFQFLKPNNFDMLGNTKESTLEQDNAGADSDVESELRKKTTIPIHVPEKVLNIDEETRMGLDQTPVDTTLISSSFTYPSLPPKKLFQLDDTKDSEASDTETKMSLMTGTEDIRLRNTISIDDATKDSVASDSNTEAATPSRRARRASREGLGISSMMESLEGGERIFTAEHLFEYQWPQDGGEWHLLQEQISEYLKVKSFKRKYPDLYRRTCDKEEKDFLRDKGVVTETQSDLGLTALRSEEVYDLMMKDYSDKYKEYISVLQEKQKKVIRETHKEYGAAKLDKTKIESYSKKAAQSAAEFNASLMKEKKDERRAYFDLQTYTIHFPKNKFGTLPSHCTKVGPYPVSLLSGQFQQHYKKYRSEELKYFPLKTSLKDPPKYVKYIRPPPPGLKINSGEKQKVTNGTNTEENNTASVEEVIPATEENVEVKPESNEKENEIVQEKEPDIPQTPIKLEKKIKSATKKKPAKPATSPERTKKVKKAEGEKSEEKEEQSGDENESSPSGSKKPPKIHGLEKCRICKKRSTKEERKNDKLVKCAECGKIGHMGCLDLTEELVAVIKTYPWQCMECKTCVECLDPFDEDKMMFCDRCDRGYHTFCIGLDALPTGHWECKSCEGCPKIIPKSQLKKKPQGTDTSGTKTEPEVKEEKSEKSVTDKAHSEDIGQTEKEDNLISNNETTGQKEDTSILKGDKDCNPSNEKNDATDSVTVEKNGMTDVAGNVGEGPVGTPLNPPVKIERRGRKRKNPDGQKPMSHKAADSATKPKITKQERIQGARQSRRLKLKEEEEEEKKKKEEEEAKKLKKKKKKKKQLAAGEEGKEATEGIGAEEGLKVKKETLEAVESQSSISVSEDLKDIVSEGVDDSAVHMFDKMDDEEKEMEVESGVINDEEKREDRERTNHTDEVSTAQLQQHPETAVPESSKSSVEETTLSPSLEKPMLVDQEKTDSALEATRISNPIDPPASDLELSKDNNASVDIEAPSASIEDKQSTDNVSLEQSTSGKLQQPEALNLETVVSPPTESFDLPVSDSTIPTVPESVDPLNTESHDEPVSKPQITTAQLDCVSSIVTSTAEESTLLVPGQAQEIPEPLPATPIQSTTPVEQDFGNIPAEEKDVETASSISPSFDEKKEEKVVESREQAELQDTDQPMPESQGEQILDVKMDQCESEELTGQQVSESLVMSSDDIDGKEVISANQGQGEGSDQ